MDPDPAPGLAARQVAEREDRQRGMNALQQLLDDGRHHPDGTVKVTQDRLAELLCISRGRVQYILRGQARKAPPREDLEKLAKALELDEDQVIRAASQVYGWNLYATKDARMQLLVSKAGPLSDHDLEIVIGVVDVLAGAAGAPRPSGQ